ncbi:uncharacterized protein [Halyomorpha halys]|uniref:uncharacterized protein n=1 Tax=Halyomorpha halys TaxID=286706 RepID=UPI0006D4D879|nr:uncharacterized protein LOC106689676 [Halyomorpha halys]
MVNCSVFGCTKRTGKDKVSFHRIPLNPELKALWVKAINRENWTPTTNCRICSDHFLPSDFNRTYHSGISHLREGAVPSIFPGSPKYMQETSQEMTIPIKRSPSTELLNATEPIPTTFPNHQQETSYEMNVSIKREPSIEFLDTMGIIPNYMPVTPCVIQLPIKREPIELSDTTEPLPMTAPTYLQETTYEMKIPIKREPSTEFSDDTEPLPLRVSTPFSLSLGEGKERKKASLQIPTNPVKDVTLVKKMMKLELRQKTYTIIKKTKKIKTLLQNKRRLKKRLDKLKAMSREVKKKNSVINDYHNMLNNMPPLAKELCTSLGKSSKIKYTPHLRSFASTLHFLSPKAYNYVRESFLSTLPHPRILTKRYEAIDTGTAAEAVDPSSATEGVNPDTAAEAVGTAGEN